MFCCCRFALLSVIFTNNKIVSLARPTVTIFFLVVILFLLMVQFSSVIACHAQELPVVSRSTGVNENEGEGDSFTLKIYT